MPCQPAFSDIEPYRSLQGLVQQNHKLSGYLALTEVYIGLLPGLPGIHQIPAACYGAHASIHGIEPACVYPVAFPRSFFIP